VTVTAGMTIRIVLRMILTLTPGVVEKPVAATGMYHSLFVDQFNLLKETIQWRSERSRSLRPFHLRN
jgi:hypothetical protein